MAREQPTARMAPLGPKPEANLLQDDVACTQRASWLGRAFTELRSSPYHEPHMSGGRRARLRTLPTRLTFEPRARCGEADRPKVGRFGRHFHAGVTPTGSALTHTG
jgi:hypothetical protein